MVESQVCGVVLLIFLVGRRWSSWLSKLSDLGT